MFEFIKQAIIVLLSFSESVVTKCIFLNFEPCLVRPTLTNLNPNKCHYYLFVDGLDRCYIRFNTLNDPSCKICVLNKTEDVNINVFNMITRVHELKRLIKHI